MVSFKKYIQKNILYILAAFFIPIFIMIGVYASIDIYWGSSRSVLASDAFSQFSNFHASFRNVLLRKQSLFYTWNAALGLNYFALAAYYLGGFFTPLVLFFPNEYMPEALYVLTLLKIGTAALSFWIYARQTFRFNQWLYVALSVSYSLMSFVTAHSELIMWLDAFIFLPMVILGVNRLLEQKKATWLFISYLCLFMTNFYMGFMIGLFSFFYFLVRIFTQWSLYKKRIIPYFTTSLLSGMGSMIIILPTIMDLRTNGEELSQITKFKTEATGFWDIIIKNMIGVFDTTKYGSIPFIYVGLVPLIFCVFYFVSPKIALKYKIGYAALFAIIIASFYIVPLNLFWHGMHAPNMFLFRYSFVFSFLVIMLAGYGIEQYKVTDRGYLVATVLFLMGLFILAESFVTANHYDYVTPQSFYFTLLFLVLYLITIILLQLFHMPKNKMALVLLILMSFEATINTNAMLNGILDDWNYASRSLYSEPFPAYKEMVNEANKQSQGEFFRLESLNPISSNDSINYGYSGISLFSSIRNRNTSSVLNTLGFRSRGTNLNLRYPNNTLLMDTFLDVRYNITNQQDPKKYGFEEVAQNQSYALYQNKNAFSLGMAVNPDIYQTDFPDTDNLTSQTNLFNALAGTDLTYFTMIQPEITNTDNTIITYDKGNVTFTEEKENIAKEVTWKVTIPAGKQAYLSLFPTDFGKLENSSASILADEVPFKTQINITGQYYNLGYFAEEETMEFTVSFYGSTEVSFIDPPIVLLDTEKFQQAADSIEQKSTDLTVGKRSVEGTMTVEEDQVLFTTIPYDKGWSAKIDGKKVPIEPFKNAFITLPLTTGTHTIKLVFLPQGLKIGILCFIASIVIFYLLKKSKKFKHEF